MTVAYAPPVTTMRPDERVIEEPVIEGPAYIRGRRSSRWHRVRSSYLSFREWRPDDLDQVWHFWCGQAASTGNANTGPTLLTDDPPADEPLCGTCEGRWLGVQADSRWLFTPYNVLDTPKVCPGSRGMEFMRETAWNRADCLVCGDHVNLRASGGPYRGTWGAQNHAPAAALIPGCLRHAWNQLVRCADDTIACACQTRPLRPKEQP